MTLRCQSGLPKPAKGREPGWPWGTESCLVHVGSEQAMATRTGLNPRLPKTTSLPCSELALGGELHSGGAAQGLGGCPPENVESTGAG